MEKETVGKCYYCRKTAETFKARKAVYIVFQWHKDYEKDARFCSECIHRVWKKIIRLAGYFPSTGRNVAKRSKGRPRERETPAVTCSSPGIIEIFSSPEVTETLATQEIPDLVWSPSPSPVPPRCNVAKRTNGPPTKRETPDPHTPLDLFRTNWNSM